MNSIKNFFIICILAAVGYGVYVAINQDPERRLPLGLDGQWSDQVDIELPSAGAPPLEYPSGTFGSGPSMGGPPSAPGATAGSMAPSFAATPPAMGNPTATAPPPYSPGVPRSAPMTPSPGGRAFSLGFAQVMQQAQQMLNQGGLVEALESLTPYYDDPTLTAAETHQLTQLLSQLAGTVIYSRQHILEQPYVVKVGETLQDIAKAYDVPWQLLAKINNLKDPQDLTAGLTLKVIRGPFDAEVRLDKYEVTLMLRGRYAGRFPIGIGSDHTQLQGTYEVKNKTRNPAYYDGNRTIDADDPANPLGQCWIGLAAPGANVQPPADFRLGIHGTNNPQNIGRAGSAGSIALGQRDIQDVYDILSLGSRVLIRR